MLYALLAPDWMQKTEDTPQKSVQTSNPNDVFRMNDLGYNAFFYPNYPSKVPDSWVKSSDIDVFEWVFVDMDLKDGVYVSKEDFLVTLGEKAPPPSMIVDSGNGIHVYWAVQDLDAMSFLRLSRRLMRLLNTDDAVQKIKQIMRLPGTRNTKDPDNFKPCEIIFSEEISFTCEKLDSQLPPITLEDEQYCQAHYNKAYALPSDIKVDEKLPAKFGQLLRDSKAAKDIYYGNVADRSTADFHLGNLMHAASFTREEAMSVLVNVQKALSRNPVHRISYAENIVDKIWPDKNAPQKTFVGLSKSVRDILSAPLDTVEGTRFPCWNWLDGTEEGFRLGHVVGLLAGVGVGKTSMALNMFRGFVQLNPNYVHMFISLEQPEAEIARRWRKMCGEDTSLYDKVHIIGNYNDDKTFRHLSLSEIKDYIKEFEAATGQKVGCVVVDHIGVLKMEDGNGENQRIIDICHQLKPFAQQTNTLFVIQSQVPREKAGIGDLEINKDGAYGSTMFEWYMDFLISIWQPLKRAHKDGAPLVTAYKFCKIRAKNPGKDKISEDICYKRIYEPETEHFRELIEIEEKSFAHFLKVCTDKRKQDRKTELVEYVSFKETDGSPQGTKNS